MIHIAEHSDTMLFKNNAINKQFKFEIPKFIRWKSAVDYHSIIAVRKWLIVAALTLLFPGASVAQNNPGNRAFNQFQVSFQQVWNFKLDEMAKLIELGKITADRRNNLMMIYGGKDQSDFKRKLVVTHWDGFRFALDGSADFIGIPPDALLVGRFVPVNKDKSILSAQIPTVPAAGKQKKKTVSPHVNWQVATGEGIYSWDGNALQRLYATPTNLRLAISLVNTPDLLLAGTGSSSVLYQVGEREMIQAPPGLPQDTNGYVRFGVGTQDYQGADQLEIASGIHYIQSYWDTRNKWFIGVLKGRDTATPLLPGYSIGDRLVVYTTKFGRQDSSFWTTTFKDMDETWRSEPLPGHILDVRVGDPKNDGKDGILVLTSENNDTQRHLYFYTVAKGSSIR